MFIGEWSIFGAAVFLCYRRFFVKGDFIIGRVECTLKTIRLNDNLLTIDYLKH